MTEKHFIWFLWTLPAAILAPFVALAAATVTMAFMIIFVAVAAAVVFLAAANAVLTFFDSKQ
jgi:hypothetical protein